VIVTNRQEKKKISGSYYLSMYDYSNPIVWKVTHDTLYPSRSIDLYIDILGHYFIAHGPCTYPDELDPINFCNYLSAGKYCRSGNKLVLIDQWNQTRIELLRCKDTLIVLKGFRPIIGNYFLKKKDKKYSIFKSSIDLYCSDTLLFQQQHNNIRMRYDSYAALFEKGKDVSSPIQPGLYLGTSECHVENLQLNKDGSFEYKIIDHYNFTINLLKGSWKQDGAFILLNDPFVNNTYYLEFLHDTLYAGFNLPGSSFNWGKYKYLLSFVLGSKR
jgi:hypothetical protein